jgi:ATP-dependent exoDNAse (exonuclease V) beta subunit
VKGLQHTMIRASAGTGKTHQLAHRYLALLLLQRRLRGGQAPERIVATTFTRKGAGEFNERILERLATAATNATEEGNLARELERVLKGDAAAGVAGLLPGSGTDLSAAALRGALAAVVDALDRLSLGTIDALMARAVLTLEFELGLGGCEILDEPAAERERERLLGEVFREVGTAELAEFHQVIKRAALKSAASWRTELRHFVEQGHGLLHQLPDAGAWGYPGLIRPGEAGWREDARRLMAEVEKADLTSDLVTKGLWSSLAWLAARQPGSAGAKPPAWLDEDGQLQRLRDAWPEAEWSCLPRSNAKTPCMVPAAIMRPLGSIVRAWLDAELAGLSARTAALHAVLSRYDACHERLARRRGRLAFADLARLLNLEGERGFGAEAALQALGFRWHQRFDHWLVDEFQDTSREQWRVLQPWLDEALQDDGGGKSVFVVGDTKQSIYGWRGGEPRLFDELESGYPGRFSVQELALSWRSRPAVLELVNAVCDPARNPALADWGLLRAAVRERWRFQEHESAPRLRHRPGYAALLLARDSGADGDPGAAAGEEKERMAGQAAAICEVLKRVRPLERGLSCAILVRRGANAQAVAGWLRSHDVPEVMVEGDCALAEQSPVVAAIVDALQWIAHPAHRFGIGHAGLTPLGELLREPLGAGAEVSDAVLWAHWSGRVAAEGAAAVTSAWCARLSAAEPDAHVRFCLGHVDELARRSGRGLSLPDWLEAVRRLTVRETAAKGTIHVMTIHKAKGLGFDVVFLPDLDLGGGSPAPFLVTRDEAGRPVGCISHPPKWLRAWRPELAAAAEAEEAVHQHEALCVLYVALTRAKEATFVIMRDGAGGRNADARAWVLGGLGLTDAPPAAAGAEGPWGPSVLAWERGAREFASAFKVEPAAEPAATAAQVLPAPVPRRRRMRPSDTGHSPGKRPAVPVAVIAAATEYGTAVHQVFEQIEWWRSDLPLTGGESALAAVRACLDVPQVAVLFTPEGPGDEAWRELPVELVDQGEWWSGVIDRLVVRRADSGAVREAVIVDFKTDQVQDAAALLERHAGQLAVYRRAVAAALGLATNCVRTVLVSTRLRCVVEA